VSVELLLLHLLGQLANVVLGLDVAHTVRARRRCSGCRSRLGATDRSAWPAGAAITQGGSRGH
jgi:hypothetical protein